MSIPLDSLCDLMDADLATLDASEFALDQRTSGAETESWHHSDAPFDDTATGGGKQHLEYIIEPEGVAEAPDQRAGRGGDVMMDAQIAVSFDFRIQPSTQVADYRKAMVAAARITSRLRRDAGWAPGYGVTYIRCVQRFEPRATDHKLLINVRTAHIIRYFEAF